MDLLSVILMAVGLAMDCFAVSTAQGLAQNRWCPQALLMVVIFGFFHGGMPLVGYFAGTLFVSFFSRFAPWIALILLSFLGGRMVWKSLHDGQEKTACFSWSLPSLLVLAVATSIDTLATGVVFIPVPETLWMAVSAMALASMFFSLAGYLIGVYAGNRFKVNVGMIGGVILILIGFKIFLEGIIS